MVKQTKNYKKGCVSKKALSAILAASMVMTSSSFVMAAPVEVEDVAVESAVEVQAVDVAEEAVGVDPTVHNEDAKVKCEVAENVTYDGTEKQPKLTITYDDDPVNESCYEVIEWGYNTEAAKEDDKNAPYAKVRFGKNDTDDYSKLQDKVVKFTISPAPLEDIAAVELSGKKAFVYDGTEKCPTFSVTAKLNEKDIVLKEGVDYELDKERADLINVGDTKSVIVKGIGNYAGTVASVDTYEIQKTALTQSMVKITTDDVAYTPSLEADSVKTQMNLVVKELATDEELTSDKFEVKYLQKDGRTWGTEPLTEVGEHQLCIVTNDSGNFAEGTEGTIVGTYSIVKDASLSMIFKNATISDFTELKTSYDGEDHFVDSIVTAAPYGDYEQDKDFEIVTPKAEWKNAGTYTIQIKGKGNFTGESHEIQVVIEPKALATKDGTVNVDDDINVKATSYKTRTGKYTAPQVTVTDDTDKLVDGTDYTYTVTGEGANAEVEITGLGNYTTVNDKGKTLKVDVTVNDDAKLPLSDDSIKVELKGSYKYNNGKQVKPADSDVVVTDTNSGDVLVNGQDYKIASYGLNTEAGKEAGSITITAVAASKYYDGEREVKFDIAGADFASEFSMDAIKQIELTTPTPQKVDAVKPVVRYNSGDKAVYAARNYTTEYYFDGKKIEKPKDTDLQVGTYTVKAIANANGYEGELETTFVVVGTAFSANVKVDDIADQSYTGKVIEPEVTVKDGAKVLVKGKEYEVVYSNNVEVGTAFVTINGIGDYSGEIIKSFNIVGTDISKAVVTAENVAYNGKAQTPEVTVKLDDKTLTADDYTVEYKDNTNVGKATVTVTGKGGFSGKAEGTFEITKAEQELSIPDFQVTALKGRNTNANEYTLQVSGALEGLTFTSSNEAIATVTDKGQILFKHKVGEATITVEAAGSDNANAGKLEVAVKVIPATPTVKVAAANNAFKVTASKVKDAGGYQVAYATKSDFSNQTKKAFNTTAKLSKTIKAKDKTKYNVKVRAYKKVNGKYVFGKWSKVQVVKTK